MKYLTIAYALLQVLSHSKNLNTNSEISSQGYQDAYAPSDAEGFLPHFDKHLDYRGKAVLDIGCGTGNLAITLAKQGARHVVGVDVDKERIVLARKKAVGEGVASSVTFIRADFVKEYEAPHLFDVAFNQSAFEHILSPLECLGKIHGCLAPGGLLGTLFGPLWLSPYGAHMWGFTPVPWVHLFFPELVVLKVRTERYRPDEIVHQYEDIRGHLNRITVKRFKQYATDAHFEIQAIRLNPAQDRGKYKLVNKVINAVGPLQEFGAHQLLAVLKKLDLREPEYSHNNLK
jgi:SAM-dependent methyltransferase